MIKDRMNVYLEHDQKAKLEAISEKTGAPVAELIRRAIKLFLKGKQHAS